MTTIKAVPARVLVIRPNRDGQYGHLNGEVSHAHTDESGFKYLHSFEPDAAAQKIVFRCQLDDHSEAPYGWTLAWSMYDRITLQEAEEAIAMLRPIERKLAKMTATEGYAVTFGAYVNRVARAVGAVRVILYCDARKRATGSPWYSHSIGEAVCAVDRMASVLHDQLHGKVAA